MKVEIVGARDYDMTDNGRRIQGVSLYMVYPESGVVGCVAEKRSYAGGFASDFVIPGFYNVEFTPKGKISEIYPLGSDAKSK